MSATEQMKDSSSVGKGPRGNHRTELGDMHPQRFMLPLLTNAAAAAQRVQTSQNGFASRLDPLHS
jgi:hypothetical protein